MQIIKGIIGLLLLTAGLGLGSPPAAADGAVRAPHIEAELIGKRTALRRGAINTVALRLAPDPHWHTYWRNPGDSGLPTRIDWQLPDGVSAGDIRWPAPTRFSLGDILNYGYEEQTLHLVDITVAEDWPAGKPVSLQATAHWLVCADICIPGQADLSLTLPVGDGEPGPWAEAFELAASRLPKPGALTGRFQVTDDEVRLEIDWPESAGTAGNAYFYPHANELLNHSREQRQLVDERTVRVSQPRSDYLQAVPESVSGIVVIDGDRQRAHAVALVPGSVGAVPAGDAPINAGAPATDQTLWAVLVAALLGGLILNLMPCVLPVLAIKALSLLERRGEEQRHQRAHALVYTVGVILSCLAIAAALLAARSAGELAGWGFQLQNPQIVGALTYVMVALGLSLVGVVTIGTRMMGVGQRLTETGDYSGSFFTGVLAVIVASPCTAPFMGAALGYAVTQPPAVALLVFGTLGLGLALPFLLIGLFPALGRLLPKPGAWMEGFKQLMAFPMFLTAVWLSWVLTRQTGADGGAALLTGIVLLCMAAWLWGRTESGARGLRGVLALALLVGAISLLRLPEPVSSASGGSETVAEDGSAPYSADRLAELRAAGDAVFLNLTADWCLSCIANERVALAAEPVRRVLAADRVHYLKGDWTNGDPEITAVLEEFGRNGVPLYVVYRPNQPPAILPQLLTPEIVLDALRKEG